MSAESSALFESFWQWRLREFPEFATFAGFHDYDDQLNDHSQDAYQRRVKEAREFLEQGEKLKRDGSERDWVSIERLIDDLNVFIRGSEHEGYVFVACYNEGLHMDFEQLMGWMEFNTLQDFQRFVGRLKAIPKRLAQDEGSMRRGIQTGKTLHAVSMEGVCEDIQTLVESPAETSVFFRPFTDPPAAVEKEAAFTSLKEEAMDVIRNHIQPAFSKMREFIEKEYLPKCRPKVGVSCMPGGDAFYLECLRYHLSLEMTPEEVHQLGLQEVARIKDEMNTVIEETGFQGDFKAFTDFLRTDPKFTYGSKEEALQGYKDLCSKQIRPTLTKLFDKIPHSEMIIKPAPESRPNAPMGYYLAGTLDGSRPGTYNVNLTKLTENKKYDMMTLSLHEGEPGHHFQGMYAIETEGVPSFRRYMEDMYYTIAPSRFPFHAAYAEGWGLYCEWLGNELGLYDDPYSRFGHLSFEMLRACRLVADTGLHAMGWSYDKALDLFMTNTSLAPKFVRNEVTRYCTWPAQACAYKVGQLRIKQLRNKAAKELGDKFDLRDFHREVLQCSCVPLTLLDKIVDKYIESTLKE